MAPLLGVTQSIKYHVYLLGVLAFDLTVGTVSEDSESGRGEATYIGWLERLASRASAYSNVKIHLSAELKHHTLSRWLLMKDILAPHSGKSLLEYE